MTLLEGLCPSLLSLLSWEKLDLYCQRIIAIPPKKFQTQVKCMYVTIMRARTRLYSEYTYYLYSVYLRKYVCTYHVSEYPQQLVPLKYYNIVPLFEKRRPVLEFTTAACMYTQLL